MRFRGRRFERAFRAAGMVLAGTLTCSSALAVELGPLSAQINPKTDSVAAIDAARVVADKDGGFAAIWAKFEFSDGQSMRARFYDKSAKPNGKEIRFDGKVAGETSDFNTLEGGVRVEGGPLLAIYGAQFKENSDVDPKAVGQAFENGKRDGKLKALAKPAIRPFRSVQLPDGRAFLSWLPFDRLDNAEGGFIGPSGAVQKPYVKLTGDRFAEDVAALDKGFVSVFQNIDETDRERTTAQIFDADGRKRGGEFEITPPRPLFKLESVGVVGLPTGGFVALSFEEGDAFLTGDVIAQAFSASGEPAGKRITLGKKVPDQPMWNAGVMLPDDGFLLALVEGEPFGDQKLVFRRYDKNLKQVGPAAETKNLDGVRRGNVSLLTDGRVATIYDLAGEKVFVQIVKP
jgi:hypothetical protein